MLFRIVLGGIGGGCCQPHATNICRVDFLGYLSQRELKVNIGDLTRGLLGASPLNLRVSAVKVRPFSCCQISHHPENQNSPSLQHLVCKARSSTFCNCGRQERSRWPSIYVTALESQEPTTHPLIFGKVSCFCDMGNCHIAVVTK